MIIKDEIDRDLFTARIGHRVIPMVFFAKSTGEMKVHYKSECSVNIHHKRLTR